MTSCFNIVDQWARIKETVSSSSPGNSTGGEVAVYDYRLVVGVIAA